MEVSGRRPAYSEDWDTGIPCVPCLVDNINENAQFYCTNCDEFLCDTCARNHRKYTISRQHQLLDRDQMPRKKISHVQDKFCAKHDGNLLEYFCDKHNTFCCSVCVTQDHDQCGVKYIDDFAKGFSSSQEYKSLLQEIKDTEKQLAEYKNKTQNKSIEVTDCFRRFKADIQLFRSEILSKVDVLEHELMQQAVKIKTDDLKAIESVTKLYDKFQADLSEISSTLSLFEQYKQNNQPFISAEKARTKVIEYNNKIRKISQENIVKRYAFSQNDEILKTLNSPRKLGSLETENEEEKRTRKGEQTEKGIMKDDSPTIGHLGLGRKEERKEKPATQNEKQITKTDIFKSKEVKFVKDINMKHNEDTELCWITGSTLMSSDLLAVTDYENYSIKVVDLQSDTITCYIKLGDRPWDITCMDPKTLVVTCNTYLVFLRYDRTLTVVKRVPMVSGCKGITYRTGKIFLTFDGKHPSVKILNNEGKVLKTFKHNDEGQNLFSCPQYITVNSDGDTMYVSDWCHNTVASLSMDGKVCNIYKHESLRGPAGLTLADDSDSIYVAVRHSFNIHQITPNCTPVRIVLERKDGLICPWTVLYNNTDKALYVSNVSISGDRLSVYNLE